MRRSNDERLANNLDADKRQSRRARLAALLFAVVFGSIVIAKVEGKSD
jgi:hypothetical protein